MSAPLLFGRCGCWATSSQYQAVVAFVPFSFGWIGTYIEPGFGLVETAGNPISGILPPQGQIPQTIYLTRKVGDFIESYDIYGNHTANDGYGFGLQTLSDPYTFDQAVQHAIDLLNLIPLFAPETIYQAHQYADAGSPTFPVRFGYGDEGGSPVAVRSELYVTWDHAGNPLISVTSAQSSGDEISGLGPVLGTTEKGAMSFLDVSGITVFSGYIKVSKCAFRTPVPIISERISTFEPGPLVVTPVQGLNGVKAYSVSTPFIQHPDQIIPVNMGAGEFVLTPDMVGTYGSIQYSTSPAPPLPPAP